MPQGATVHYIDPGIDTGDIIFSKRLPVSRHDTYESLNYRIAILAGELMAQALIAISNGNAPRKPQDPDVGETYKVIPDDLLEQGKQRLAEGQYSHYTE
jgi:methionyl-tRNA formyltransferase